MKAWRKHNQKQAAKIQQIREELEYYNTPDERKRLEAKLKQEQNFKLTTKHERRTQYSAEVATPSYLLLAMFKRVGLWIPS
jgi:phosphoenolpyruvate synthase/pyruvate phosphate dikinase